MKGTRTIVGLGALAGILVAGGFLAGRLWASGIPAKEALTYSGVLEDASGNRLTGNHGIQIYLWDSSQGGSVAGATPLCQTPPPTAPIPVAAGHFSITLPDTCTAAVSQKPDVWTEVVVDGVSTGVSKLGAVPYAVEADHAVKADRAATASSAAVAASAARAGAAESALPGTFAVPGSLTVAGDAGVGGVLSVGVRMETDCAKAADGLTDCTCKQNEIAIAGGAYSGTTTNALNESRNLGGDLRTWRTSCVQTTSDPVGRTSCAAMFALCARLGP